VSAVFSVPHAFDFFANELAGGRRGTLALAQHSFGFFDGLHCLAAPDEILPKNFRMSAMM
jgi:hypothetical protein